MSEHFPPLVAHAIGVERHNRIILRSVLALLGVAIASLFLPWQQTVQGTGVVTALRPEDRPQLVQTIIAGRIDAWHVAEGQFVERGQLLVELSEVKDAYLDPQTLQRYGEQLVGKQGAVAAKREKISALEAQRGALQNGRRLALLKAENSVRQYEASLLAAQIDSTVAADQLRRNQRLFEDGLKSRAEYEAYQSKDLAARAKLVAAQQALASARIELNSVAAEYDEKLAKTRSDQSATAAEVAEGNAEVAKLQTQRASLARRTELYRLVAPQAGYVVRALRAGIGENVKEGETIVTIMPSQPARAVELYVKANDVPLLSVGRKTRLQFDGWPALQFSGWPSVAVGTFGGEVRAIDAVASSDGKYRVLIAPDSTDEPWPERLRVGSGVLGWAALDEVRLGFEVWRRLNGFPPTLRSPSGEKAK